MCYELEISPDDSLKEIPTEVLRRQIQESLIVVMFLTAKPCKGIN
jgi:hypothetical protein